METLHIVVLALVQGLTEFLPVSSSAHLILVPVLFGWPDQGLSFDVAVHLGTLLAVLAYFRTDLLHMSGDWLRSLTGGGTTANSRLAWAVLLGTIPVGLTGLLLGDFIEHHLRSPQVIAVATIGFGVLLWIAERRAGRGRDEHSIGWKDVLLIGCAQALAMVPGTSRSGITITAGLLAGLTRVAAARFSFLLSIPVIVLAGGLKTLDLIRLAEPVAWGQLALGTALAAISAYLCIDAFLGWLDRLGMTPFVIYRVLLGVVLLVVFA